MNESFADFLSQMQADPNMILQALRMHLSERTNDLTREEMLKELNSAAASTEEFEQQLRLLERDSPALEQVALIYFERAWEDGSQRTSIRTAFEQAKRKLPVVEIAILATVAMYGMYLVRTGGVTEVKIRRKPDGSYEKTEKREPFAPIVASMAKLLGNKG